jgi:hypothetical protein
MKKQYRMAINKHFSSELEKIDPGFEKISVISPCKYDGETVFVKKADNATLFICLIPDPKGREEFTVEIGWSTKHRFPELSIRPSIEPGGNNDEFTKDEAMVRLTSFTKMDSFGWKFNGVESEFEEKYLLRPEVLKSTPKKIVERDFKRIPGETEAVEVTRGAVYEAVNTLKIYGMPYLDKFLRTI